MELFTIIVNSFWPFAIVAKSSILNIVGFLDPPLHCNKFAAKAVSWFVVHISMVGSNIKGWYVYMHTLGEII